MKPDEIKDNKFSAENHTMLVQLRDNVGTLSSTVTSFITAQGEENRRLHGRIDLQGETVNRRIEAQGEALSRAVGSIKDSIAERARVTPALIAMILSSIAILGGAGTAYIGLQTAPIKTDIANAASEIHQIEAQRLIMRQDLVALQIKSASEDARQDERSIWTTKLLEEIRKK